MAQNESSSADENPGSESAAKPTNLRERAATLKKKVGELAKTFEHIEQHLAEAAKERPESPE
jgi:hypothetical protein